MILFRSLLAIGILSLLAACSGTGSKPPVDSQIAEPTPYIVEPLLLASEVESALLSGADVLQMDVDTKLVQPVNPKARATFLWQVPNQKLDNFDAAKAMVFIDKLSNKLQVRLRRDANFAYSFSAAVKRWPQSDSNKLLVIIVASDVQSLPELQAIMLDELYMPMSLSQKSITAPEQQFINAWLTTFLDRNVGYRARLQQLPSI